MQGASQVRGLANVIVTLKLTSLGKRTSIKGAHLFVNLVLFFASVGLTLILSEFALRVLGWEPMYVSPERDRFWTYDPLLGWAHQPGQEGWFETAQFRTYVRINSHGLRDREHAYERTLDGQRILILGDSFAWGYGVDEPERFSQHLETSLGVEVINAGVSGYSTDQELLWYSTEGVKYDVDLMILVLTGNDVGDNHRPLVSNIYYKPRYELDEGRLVLQGQPVPRTSVWGRFVYQLSQRSSLAYLSIQRYFELRAALATGKAVTSQAPASTAAHPAERQPFELTLALLNEIRMLAHANGAGLILVTTDHWWNEPTRATYPEFVAALAANGFLVVDVEALAGFDRNEMLIPEDGHWNSEGHRFVAEQLTTLITSHELLKMSWHSLNPLHTNSTRRISP